MGQPWYCAMCARTGEIAFTWREEPGGIWERIERDHARVSADCAAQYGSRYVRPVKVERWEPPAG